MPLATKEQVLSKAREKLQDIPGFTETINRIFIQNHANSYSKHFDTENNRSSTQLVWNSTGASTVKNLSTIVKKLPNNFFGELTGWDNNNTWKNRLLHNIWKEDFLYHWIDNFENLSSKESIHSRLLDPSTCAAYATVVAVNRHLELYEGTPFYEGKKKDLLKGSVFRWTKKGESSWLIPANFHKTSFNGTPMFIKVNSRFVWEKSFRNLREEINNLILDAQTYNNPRQLLPYNSKATDRLSFRSTPKDTHKTFLGVELELEGMNPGAYTDLDLLISHAIIKRDGSLQNGVEICTAPSTLDIHKEVFKPFFEALKKESNNLEASSSCGLHIHIDKHKMSKLHIANLQIFMNSDENDVEIVKIAGRPANNYCKRVKGEYYQFTTGQIGHDRYTRVNHTNAHTLEFRLFASTVKFEDFCKRLEFTQAVVNYTIPGNAGVTLKELPNWDNFKTFVLTKSKLYPTLSKGL